MTSPGEGVTVFTHPYLSAGSPALGEAKGLINDCYLRKVNDIFQREKERFEIKEHKKKTRKIIQEEREEQKRKKKKF